MKIAEQQVTYIDHCGSDLSVVNAARVSFNKESSFLELIEQGEHSPVKVLSPQDEKLINYLAKHSHKSPFNHCFLSFRVKAPIFVARQLVKHEYLPWNEVSRRYVDEEPEFFFPATWGRRAENVKQGAAEERYIDDVIGRHEVKTMLKLYEHCLRTGMAPEDARMFLPQNTMTEWIWSGTLFAFVKMLKLRRDSHAQQETREVAELIAKEIQPRFPVSYKALMEYGQT